MLEAINLSIRIFKPIHPSLIFLPLLQNKHTHTHTHTDRHTHILTQTQIHNVGVLKVKKINYARTKSFKTKLHDKTVLLKYVSSKRDGG